MHAYEIEIKSLLGSEEAANTLRTKMKEVDPACKQVGANKQLNHYFVGGTVAELYDHMKDLFGEDEHTRLKRIVDEGHNVSVRTREMDGTVLLVVKASVDDTSSENGIARIEFEANVAMTLNELDRKLLAAGYEYQAKWSREREEYAVADATVTIDRNAGYGYLAEFEKVVDDPARTGPCQKELRALMKALGVEELPQERLERMFAHYNEHWPEYYGTDKVFTIE